MEAHSQSQSESDFSTPYQVVGSQGSDHNSGKPFNTSHYKAVNSSRHAKKKSQIAQQPYNNAM